MNPCLTMYVPCSDTPENDSGPPKTRSGTRPINRRTHVISDDDDDDEDEDAVSDS